jgi:hypothetical protein
MMSVISQHPAVLVVKQRPAPPPAEPVTLEQVRAWALEAGADDVAVVELSHALLPVFHQAMAEKGERLDLLATLELHAADTAPMRQLLDLVHRAVAARNQGSVVFDFAQRHGFGRTKRFFVHWVVTGDRLGVSGAPMYQAQVAIDSTRPEWFQVLVAEIPGLPHAPRRTEFSEGVRPVFRDELDIGRCTADELPRWFAGLASRFGVRWEVSVRNASVRGKNQLALSRWLQSAK